MASLTASYQNNLAPEEFQNDSIEIGINRYDEPNFGTGMVSRRWT